MNREQLIEEAERGNRERQAREQRALFVAYDRRLLIEKAAKAILDASDIHPDDPDGDHGYYAQTWQYAVRDAVAALAVFEQAYTLKERECGFMGCGSFRCANVCTPTPPTADEREAQGWREAEAYADDHDPSKRAETADDFMTGWRAADRLRRTAQGEPTLRDHVRALTGETDAGLSELGGFQSEPIRVNTDAPIPYVGTTDDFMVNTRAQREPTDAQVHAAAVTLDPSAWEPGANYQSQTFSRARDASLERAHAALRAAFNETGGNHGRRS